MSYRFIGILVLVCRRHTFQGSPARVSVTLARARLLLVCIRPDGTVGLARKTGSGPTFLLLELTSNHRYVRISFRAMGLNPRQIDRLLDLRHASTVA